MQLRRKQETTKTPDETTSTLQIIPPSLRIPSRDRWIGRIDVGAGGTLEDSKIDTANEVSKETWAIDISGDILLAVLQSNFRQIANLVESNPVGQPFANPFQTHRFLRLIREVNDDVLDDP